MVYELKKTSRFKASLKRVDTETHSDIFKM